MAIVRAYEPADLAAVADLMEDLGYPTTVDEMQRRMDVIASNPFYHTFVAEQDGQVVGMIGIRISTNYEVDDVVTYISALVVKKELQGQGIGKQLIHYVEDWSIRNGSNILYLTSGIKEERKAAHEMYKKLGFEITGYRFVKRHK
ncbi:ribosomal protein S18 acetylase RimI-like enzyme [Paenibacillus cellulosilyticus]|uniref:Ribosomal protein S18 acetylase RimI-like enzyme n=1 Tax=Paenibacillus cellulosilyticus TaxID=375489 RepID=A0A2V2YLM2_9BACL|nr:GNAT family N-acetyltransferase [Paenibacillus cellulosilyticus]PWV94529.1 ribosomal protein S18 acetylase RimI-like enzyme [Paenibacillus cellulosilyticus]QKS45033.1 GNAT family N-acetyltransferase [Paenibacillus cellulosilyticus]